MASAPPFRQFVLKVATRCDLACDHCYVYEAADTSWRHKPRFMTDEIVRRTAERIAEHATAHRLPAVALVLHGGEPLLLGPTRMRATLTTLRDVIESAGCAVDLRIHTNGVRLTSEYCDLFREHRVRVGVSLDGDRTATDRHRRFANGASSHMQALRAVALLRDDYPDIYAGVLCTIDIRNDPVAVYEAVRDARPPRADFLLPHATHSDPPVRANPEQAEYADWMLEVFDRWNAESRPFPIRSFTSVLDAFRGLPSGTESLGLDPVDLVVVEADGTLEQTDSLKAAYDGAPATGFTVAEHSFDEVSVHSGFEARRHGLADLCETCQRCPVVAVCGGGLRTHRYSAPSRTTPPVRPPDPFDNPSVYCRDLKELVTGIRTRTQTSVVARVPAQRSLGLSADVLHQLAHGYGDAKAVAHLNRFQRSLHILLLAKVFAAAEGNSGSLQELVDAAIAMLKTLDAGHKNALHDVLGHPYTSVWALRCLDDAQSGHANPEDFAHLASLAAAIAIRAVVDAEIEVPVRRGAVYLPTLGRLVVGADAGRSLTMRISGGDCDVFSAPGWQGVRRVALPSFAGGGIALEDTDPFRRCHHWEVAQRLPDSDATTWIRTVPAAWDLLARDHHSYAPGIAAGLSTIVPLAPSLSGRAVSSTARRAYGAIGVALPVAATGPKGPSASTLALLMIHEFQHAKLGAVLDMADLHDPHDTRLFEAPWRQDLRPLEGLLQGTYAHVGVTDFWRVRRFTALDSEEREHAEEEFALWFRHTLRATHVLAGSGSLTPLGLHFVEALRTTLEAWTSKV
ncbi:Radical SAM domain protein [Catenulispora acidiphila DSM 44928]|uniref:Radical SAM domain protein n=1 Tax=Catenulispora acidiphila (strain DSM 44928 / JCM 14897 / NBRC 102108 / NRRL B-24433 / ID139908) TaxID=479433 RepID=C7QFK1_CATAD|nr:FxsB family cyclophane-forming radical SAM/SPASM peptide maturase [Catenulispora acidiphila]ACU76778.1 Radical SAM domain protein [Catenulispora acidiphila DSM 44928]